MSVGHIPGLDIDALIRRCGLISDQVNAAELRVILENLAAVLDGTPAGVLTGPSKAISSDGAIVEFGCYRGTTSLYIRRVLDAFAGDHPFHVYDSFAGLPEKTPEDSSPAGLQFVAGELGATKKGFLMEFKKAGLKPPVVHKGWFDELTSDSVPDNIIFAFLDGDYYGSIRSSLRLIEDKLAPGAVIVVDDYANEALPGAAKAADEWVRRHRLNIRVVRSLGIIKNACG